MDFLPAPGYIVIIERGGMSLGSNFSFVEKEDVPFAIELAGGRIFRMDGRDLEKWVEITDSDSRCRIESNASPISESEALALASELAEDIAAFFPNHERTGTTSVFGNRKSFRCMD